MSSVFLKFFYLSFAVFNQLLLHLFGRDGWLVLVIDLTGFFDSVCLWMRIIGEGGGGVKGGVKNKTQRLAEFFNCVTQSMMMSACSMSMTMCQLLISCSTYIHNLNLKSQRLACQRMIAVHDNNFIINLFYSNQHHMSIIGL